MLPMLAVLLPIDGGTEETFGVDVHRQPRVVRRLVGVTGQYPDIAADVLIALRQSGVGIASLSVQKPTLDEVFLALTGHDTGAPRRRTPSSSTRSTGSSGISVGRLRASRRPAPPRRPGRPPSPPR